MKLINWVGAGFELLWAGLWGIVLLTAIGLNDFWIELFTATPEVGGTLAWAMTMIIAIEGIRLVKFKGLAKAIKEWQGEKKVNIPKYITKIEVEERIKDAQSEIRICRKELKRREKKMRSKK